MMHTQIFQTFGFNMPQQFCHAVNEGFAADKSGARCRLGASRQMLAAAKADFQRESVKARFRHPRAKPLREIAGGQFRLKFG